MALDELYQEVLLDHYKQPRNKGVLAEPDIRLELKNPFCGDEILLTLKMAEGRVAEAAFEGHGCVISQASASVMTEKIKGLRVEEDAARSFCSKKDHFNKNEGRKLALTRLVNNPNWNFTREERKAIWEAYSTVRHGKVD